MSNTAQRQEPFRVPTPEELGFDPAELRRKYAAERDKRMRAVGNAQYVEVAGDYARYEIDPYVTPGFTRDAVEETLDVVILGGGFGGLLAAARLREAGVGDLRIIEKGGDFGGTWYWNRYPGAQCDIESYIYLPLLDETGYVPTEKYAFQPEIYEHARRIGKHYELYDRALFQTQYTELRWQEDDKRWLVKTDRGDVLRARFVVMSSGPLNRPKLPGIPGLENFRGHAFHTSRWDYAYTGGDTTGNLTGLADKRVGIIGTGGTALQAISHLGACAKQLYVFQRTPSSVDRRENAPTDPAWAKSLKPGWQAERNENFCSILAGLPVEVDMVNDRWTSFFKLTYEILGTNDHPDLSDAEIAAVAEIADFQKGNEIRARVDETVKDATTAAALKPWYGQWCKRPTFNDDYLPTFNRPNVALVDTDGQGVERITENAVVAGGVAYEVDCLVFATGFEVGTAYTRRAECEIFGRGGQTLTDYWANGMKTYHGFLSRGFPNFFHMGLTQTGLAFNFTYTLNGQSIHIAHLVSEVLGRDATTVEPTVQAQQAWVDLVSAPGPMRKYQETCTPGYYNSEGKNTGQSFLDNLYPEGAVPFFRLLAEWREQGDLQGLEIE